MNDLTRRFLRAAIDAAVATFGPSAKKKTGTPTKPKASKKSRTSKKSPAGSSSSTYPGDFTGRFEVAYAPHLDGEPDPGEIVWTWVPYEEDASQGKDRPVLLVGRDDGWLLGLMLTSKDHDRDAADEARWGRHWMDIGTGDWDRKKRPSEVRLDRVLRVDPDGVRREGAVLDRARFSEVETALRSINHW